MSLRKLETIELWLMSRLNSQYPDISDILARKAAWRRQRAALSFAEKLDILDALRERMAPIVAALKARSAQPGTLASKKPTSCGPRSLAFSSVELCAHPCHHGAILDSSCFSPPGGN